MPPVHQLAAIILGCATATASTAIPRSSARLLVRFEDGVIPSLAALPLPAGTRLLEPQHPLPPPGSFPRRPGFQPTPFHILALPAGADTTAVVANLAGNPALTYAEPDIIFTAGEFIPNDPGAASQWHHSTIRSRIAWDQTQGSPDVILAVMDTGINAALPDFAGRIVPGYDFVNLDADPNDDHGHGSSVTSVAAGTGNNGQATAGIDWRCRIMPLKTLDQNAEGLSSDWIAALDYAVTNGADVINLSAGSTESSAIFTEAIDRAIAAGVIIVTITHNDGLGTIRFPGNLPECITVGATRSNDRRATYSNYGPQIDLVAPGGVGSGGITSTNIVSTAVGGSQANFWGTSYAGPQVAGTATLIKALRPEIRQAEMEAILCAAAIDQIGGSTDTPGFDIYHGYGRLDIPNALALTTASSAIQWLAPGQVRLSWDSPPSNAVAKKPYALEYTDDLTHWFPINPSTPLTLVSGKATWTDDGTFTNSAPGSQRFYRSSIRR